MPNPIFGILGRTASARGSVCLESAVIEMQALEAIIMISADPISGCCRYIAKYIFCRLSRVSVVASESGGGHYYPELILTRN